MAQISIVVPAYNEGDFLAECVSSLRTQTFPDIEIILVDDGSTDSSSGYLSWVSSLDGRIKVIHQKNCGSTAARKTGMRLATGKYVTFVDADDWIEEDLCDCLYRMAESYQADLVIGGHYLDSDGGAKKQGSTLAPGGYRREDIEKEIFPQLFHDDFYSGWSIYPYLCGKLFLREKLLPYMERVQDGITLGDDVCVTFPYLLDCQSLAMTEKPLYHYVQREQSQSHGRMKPEDMQNIRDIYSLVLEALRQHGMEEGDREKLRTYILTTMLMPRFPWLLSKRLAQREDLPFFGICRGSKVIIYGAGVFGRSLKGHLHESGFAEVVLWLDARAKLLRAAGYEIMRLQEVESWPSYDYVIIPIMNKAVVKAVSKDLLEAGIFPERIKYLDEEYVKSEEVWRMFGMEAADG